MLYQLHHAGVLARQRAILLGQFTEYELNRQRRRLRSRRRRRAAAVAAAACRCFTGLPFGHVADKLTLPVGGHCALDVRDGHARSTFSDYGR